MDILKWVRDLERDLEYLRDSDAYLEKNDEEGLIEEIIYNVQRKRRELEILHASVLAEIQKTS